MSVGQLDLRRTSVDGATWRWTPADDDRLSTAFMVGGLRVDSLLGLDLSEPPIPGAIWAFDKHVFDAFNEVGDGDRRVEGDTVRLLVSGVDFPTDYADQVRADVSHDALFAGLAPSPTEADS